MEKNSRKSEKSKRGILEKIKNENQKRKKRKK